MADLDNVGKNLAQSAGNEALNKANDAAKNKANISANSSNASSTSSRPKYQAIPNTTSSTNETPLVMENDGNSNNDESLKQKAKNIYLTRGASSLKDDDLSSEEKKAVKKEQDAQNNAKTLDTAADVAVSSGNGYAKLFGYLHKGLNYATKGKWSDWNGRLLSKANKATPGGNTAQKLINKAGESGATEKAGEAISTKNTISSMAGGKAAEKAGEKVEEKAAEESAKNVASNTAAKVSESGSSGQKILKNPAFWIICGFVTVFMMIIIFLLLLVDGTSLRYGSGKYEYVDIKHFDQIVVHEKDGTVKSYDIDTYVAGVLYAESGEFSDSEEYMKVQAVAARTYALRKMITQKYVINSSNNQNSNCDERYIGEGTVYYKAAHDTSGLVLVSGEEGNYEYYSAEYDALAINPKCGGEENVEQDYFITCQKQVRIPISWTKSKRLSQGDINYYKNHYHGRGMSQWGAYYLTLEQNKDFDYVLNLFYDKAKIVSIYPVATSYGYSYDPVNVNITVKTTDPSTKGKELVPRPSLEGFLSSKGTSIQSANDNLLQKVKEAGVGTRASVVTAAIFPINLLEPYGIRLPYNLGGGWGGHKNDKNIYSYYGLNPDWGTSDEHTAKGVHYKYKGLDCAAFVRWAFRNGGIELSRKSLACNKDGKNGFGATSFYCKNYSMAHTSFYRSDNIDEYVGQPGDVLVSSSSSHVMLIVDSELHGNTVTYTIAHAEGYSDGYNVNIKEKKGSSKLYVVRMDWYYNNAKVSNFESKFNKGRLD